MREYKELVYVYGTVLLPARLNCSFFFWLSTIEYYRSIKCQYFQFIGKLTLMAGIFGFEKARPKY